MSALVLRSNVAEKLCNCRAVRGEIVQLAQEIQKELKDGKKHPFDKVVMCNIGNPQALGQQPITFFRQVLALSDYPQVIALPRCTFKLCTSDLEEHLLPLHQATIETACQKHAVLVVRSCVAG